jgi:hypothetical protein
VVKSLPTSEEVPDGEDVHPRRQRIAVNIAKPPVQFKKP